MYVRLFVVILLVLLCAWYFFINLDQMVGMFMRKSWFCGDVFDDP